MPANTLPIFPLVVKTSAVSFVNADGTTEKTLVTAGSNGTRIDSIAATSTDTATKILVLSVYDGATSYPIGEVTIPIGAGTDGSTLAVKVLSLASMPWLDSSGSIFLASTWSLRVAPKTAVTSAKVTNVVAFSGDY